MVAPEVLQSEASARLASDGAFSFVAAELGRIAVAEGDAAGALVQVARLAVAAVPGATEALVHLVERGAPPLVVATDSVLLTEGGNPIDGRSPHAHVRVSLGDAGVLVLVAHEERFDEEASAVAVEFARCAVGVVTNIARLAELERVNRQLAEALTSRDVIGQAKGILRERFGYSDQEAFDELRRGSQCQRRKLRTVAEAILDGVGRGKMR